ncbi:hypothetical protein QQ045_001541 [Rhodiola kirilowii]
MDHNPPNPNDDRNPNHHRGNPHLSINKLSHKISKPSNSNSNLIQSQKAAMDPPPPQPINPTQNPNPPPVYNISKSDFRDMVQKLTGAPASELAEMSRAQHAPPKPPSSSSRLHRIRPPPLAQLTSFGTNQNHQPGGQPLSQSGGLTNYGSGFVRSGVNVGQPLSPLPPLPAVHAAAESPISAYMRHLRGDSEPRRLLGFSSSWRGAQDDSMPHPPSSPLGFGCFPPPKSPNMSLSPTAGQLGFPLSPTGKP